MLITQFKTVTILDREYDLTYYAYKISVKKSNLSILIDHSSKFIMTLKKKDFERSSGQQLYLKNYVESFYHTNKHTQ